MVSEPLTLYKLMVLQMLKHVRFPLTNSQIADFFLTKEYANYFTLQQALSELQESNLIRLETVRSCSRYQITKEGEETLSFFGSQLSDGIVQDIRQFLDENKAHMREEVSLITDYHKSDNRDYIVHCEAREGNAPLLSLDISVPAREQAEVMCLNWADHNQEIYAFIMNTLMREL